MKRIKEKLRGCLYLAAALLLTLNLAGCGLLADYAEEQVFEYAPEEYTVTESYEAGDIEEPDEAESPESYEDASAAEVAYYFRNSKLLDQHFQKHGIEMGFSSAEEYEAAASAVINNPESLHKTEAEDGDDVYYLEETNEFVVVSTDGYIRTYFLPDGGKAYFDRQ